MSVQGDVGREVLAQDAKWGADRDLENDTWLRVLVEEVGEAAADISDHKPPWHLYREVIQCAAVAVQWAENIKRRHPEELRGQVGTRAV